MGRNPQSLHTLMHGKQRTPGAPTLGEGPLLGEFEKGGRPVNVGKEAKKARDTCKGCYDNRGILTGPGGNRSLTKKKSRGGEADQEDQKNWEKSKKNFGDTVSYQKNGTKRGGEKEHEP